MTIHQDCVSASERISRRRTSRFARAYLALSAVWEFLTVPRGND